MTKGSGDLASFRYRNFDVVQIAETINGALGHGWQSSCPLTKCPKEIHAVWPSLMRTEITQHVLDHQRRNEWPYRKVGNK